MSFTPHTFKIKPEPITPDFYSPAYSEDPETYREAYFGIKLEPEAEGMRKSLSLSNLAVLNSKPIRNFNLMKQDTKVAVLDRYKTPQKRYDLVKGKYMSIAEQIYHYQRDTPERFHSAKEPFIKSSCFVQSHLTKPQSPALRCKTRSRPLKIPTREEIEEQEFEEMQKHQIKAHAIPRCVFEGSRLPAVPRKPPTQPEPFKLKELPKKITPKLEKTEEYKFIAKPAPKDILEKPQKLKKNIIKPTVTMTPTFVRKYIQMHNTQSTSSEKSMEEKSQRKGPSKPIPFSFEKRDEEIRKRREQRIKQIELEEKKMREFHARPIPNIIKKRLLNELGKSETTSRSSENKENEYRFESKPPLVLHQKPFVPVLQEKPPTKPIPFELKSEKRASERQEFEELLKLKQLQLEEQRLARERETKEEEQRLIAEMRARAVHQAQPVPDFTKPPTPKSKCHPTIPQTPTFLKRNAKA